MLYGARVNPSYPPHASLDAPGLMTPAQVQGLLDAASAAGAAQSTADAAASAAASAQSSANAAQSTANAAQSTANAAATPASVAAAIAAIPQAAAPATIGLVNPATGTDQTLGTGSAIHRFANLVTSALATLQSVLTNLVYATGATLVLRSSLGASASDVGVKLGSSETDTNANNSTKLISVRTGLGGTEVEKAYIDKTGKFACLAEVSFGRILRDTSALGLWGVSGAGNGQTIATFESLNNLTSGSLLKLNNFGTTRFSVGVDGAIGLRGSDSSGTPGNATLSVPQGKSAIASGATSVRVTNTMVAAGDQVFITWHGDHGQARSWVTTGAGFFDVTLNAAASANTSFCWAVSKRI